MPELPEVETVKRGLATHLDGRTVDDINIFCSRLRYPVDPRLKRTLPGKTVQNIERRGKYLLFRFDRGGLIWHLGMSGSLRIVPPQNKRLKHDHIEMTFQNSGDEEPRLCLRFNDPRRFGLLLATDDIDAHRLICRLGVEPLSDAFRADDLRQKLQTKKIPVKQAIMDSRLVVGVGNIYASEALFRANVHPLQSANSLNKTQCVALTAAIKTTLERAIRAGGTTLRNFIDTTGKPGYFKQLLLVYQRDDRPCRWCRTPIKKIVLGNRSTFYCPRCQSSRH